MSVVGNPFTHRVITNPAIGTTGAYIGVSAAADILRYSPPTPILILRWGLLATTTINDATNALKMTCDLRPTVGSDVGRLTGATFTVAVGAGYNAAGQPAFYVDYGGAGTTLGLGGGSITLTAGTSQLAAGKGVFHNVNPQAPTSSTIAGGVISSLSGTYPAPDTAFVAPGGVDTQFVVYPGQEVLIRVQPNAPGAGAGIAFLDIVELPFVGDNNNYANVASLVPSSIAPTPSNATVNMTRVLS